MAYNFETEGDLFFEIAEAYANLHVFSHAEAILRDLLATNSYSKVCFATLSCDYYPSYVCHYHFLLGNLINLSERVSERDFRRMKLTDAGFFS